MKFFFNKRPKDNGSPEIIPGEDDAIIADKPQQEIAAVIALALHMYITQVRAYENSIITIQKIMKPYSPWSSKIYGMRPPIARTPATRQK